VIYTDRGDRVLRVYFYVLHPYSYISKAVRGIRRPTNFPIGLCTVFLAFFLFYFFFRPFSHFRPIKLIRMVVIGPKEPCNCTFIDGIRENWVYFNVWIVLRFYGFMWSSLFGSSLLYNWNKIRCPVAGYVGATVTGLPIWSAVRSSTLLRTNFNNNSLDF